MVDPVTATRLAPLDSQRIQRALEVFRITGLPLSHFHIDQNAIKSGATNVDSKRARALFSLEPLERSWLHSRIALRFDTMLAQGFVELRSMPQRHIVAADQPNAIQVVLDNVHRLMASR